MLFMAWRIGVDYEMMASATAATTNLQSLESKSFNSASKTFNTKQNKNQAESSSCKKREIIHGAIADRRNGSFIFNILTRFVKFHLIA